MNETDILTVLKSHGFSETIIERFWSKVDKNGPLPEHLPHLGNCWVWIGSKNPNGYGQIQRGARGKGIILSDKVSYILHYGLVPEGHCILHHCDYPPCVRPNHLFTGTLSDNTQDAIKKGRLVPPPVHYGKNHPTTRILPEDAIKIEKLYADGLTLNAIAAIYGTSIMPIWQIVHKNHWSNRSSERANDTTTSPA